MTKNTKRRPWAQAFLLLAALVLPALFTLSAADKPSQARAVVAGSVFDSDGRSLPGCKVMVVSESNSKQKQQALTDRRGEFAVRVPVGRYVVSVTAKGFQAQQKTVQLEEGEKSNATFQLSTEQSAQNK
jgi:uncharacterized membrane protein